MRVSRNEIMTWLEAKQTRTVYSAAIQFDMDPQQVWDILNAKEDIHLVISEKCMF